MSDQEQRDQTHVEQHGDGDVNIEQPAEDTGSDEQSQDEQESSEADE